MLSSGMMASLEHIHQTSQWYTDLLQAHSTHNKHDLAVACQKVVVLRASETWREAPENLGHAEKMVRQFMGAVFQSDADVMKRVADIAGGSRVPPVSVPGTHFSML